MTEKKNQWPHLSTAYGILPLPPQGGALPLWNGGGEGLLHMLRWPCVHQAPSAASALQV